MKKILKSLLVVALLLVQFVPMIPVNAAEETGTITIDNALVGKTYSIYQILEIESYNSDTGAYAYKAAAKWATFINSTAVDGVYVNVDDQGYVTWVEGADVAAFAKAAKEWASTTGVANDGTDTAESTTVQFIGLDLGYYLVDSSTGTICSLDTTRPTVTIKEKNGEPTVDKLVEEDSTGSFGATNTAGIGETVNYKSTITVEAGAQNYILHDEMTTGLTFGSVSKVELNGAEVAAENYTVTTTGLTDDCTFEVDFTDAFEATLKADDKIVVYYSATVNENAVIAGDGNVNEIKISYGENSQHESTPATTTTYVWEFDLIKKGKDNVDLEGAEFVLSTDQTVANAITFVYDESTKTYRVAKTGETGTTTISAGSVYIDGLDAGTYYLIETAAPAGYNKLANPVVVEIAQNGQLVDKDATLVDYSGITVTVTNTTGSLLPDTGGIGTVLFITIGSIMVLGFGVLLVAKFRLAKEM